MPQMTLPAANSNSAPASRRRLSVRPVNVIRTGEPTAYTSEYTVTSCPAADAETRNASAISGRKPAIMNASVPMTNEPSARSQMRTFILISPLS